MRLAVEAAGKHRYIRPRRPEQNAKVERTHRTDVQGFWSHREFYILQGAEPHLRVGEHTYDAERFSLALNGHTPNGEARAEDARHRRVPITVGCLTNAVSEHAPSIEHGGARSERAKESHQSGVRS